MSRAAVVKHYTRILERWPVDQLRPEHAFQSLLRQRIKAAPTPEVTEINNAQAVYVPAAKIDPNAEMKQVNALYSLLDDRYARKYPVSNALREPASSPEYYTQLLKEVEETPQRSWFSDLVRKYTGMVRMQ